MVGMYQKQLLDAPFALNGHCGDQPSHAPAAPAPSPYPPNPSSSSGAAPSPHAQADGAGQPRRLFQALVGGILQRGAGGGNGVAGDLEALVSWAREVAVDPCAKRPADRPMKRQVLALRRARYLKMEDVADQAELPSFSKVRTKSQTPRAVSRDLLLICRGSHGLSGWTVVYHVAFVFSGCFAWMGHFCI